MFMNLSPMPAVGSRKQALFFVSGAALSAEMAKPAGRGQWEKPRNGFLTATGIALEPATI
jgi:hypothetical protein